ncbi:sensor histidine kinase [Fulvivirgaceae bacterium BMA12]|uniref:Oxygen sensor histidine kinase NreB n=1 Tax=Agaribacillus aureus TaxID=3051825 RepID=A0ABT8LIZ8_9BACT|nr:sensor histidine kinase [Fulvivirgaceae bacterium BMA12]
MYLFLNRALVIVTLSCLLRFPCYGQQPKIDSLLNLVSQEENGRIKSKIYLQLSELSTSLDLKKSLHYANEATKLTDEDEILADIWDQKGRLFFASNKMDNALESFQRAKAYKENVSLYKDAARINNRVGAVLVRLKNYERALSTFLESMDFFEKENDQVNLAICYNNMAGIFAATADFPKAVKYNEQALEIFKKNELKEYAIITLPSLAGQYLKLNDTTKAIAYNLEAEQLGLELKHYYGLGIAYNNLGQLYFEKNDPHLAVTYYEKSIAAKQHLGAGANLVPTYNNLGQSYIALNQPEQAIYYLKKGLQMAKSEELLAIYSNLTKAYMSLNKKDSAAIFFELTGQYRDSVFSIEKQQVMDELMTKYETEKKEKEIIELAAQKRSSQYILYGVLGLLLATILLALLVMKNFQKKKLIAQQSEELKKQQIEQLLKEQEITGIDAMLKGQETERKKIAEELHDSLGSSLSTLKLYINNLDHGQGAEVFQNHLTKAEKLLDETYQQVRKIAHNKSAGVLMNKGLVPAVRATANKISAAKKLQIEVIDVGLSERLENSVEIAIFRSIQELLSNVVKYSDASEAIVQITQHDDALNIVVEDNGKGFQPEKTPYGMGLTNIQNRLDKLNGQMNIDSSPGNGATVIINVPVT